MDLDIEDVVAGAVGSVFGRFILFLVAVWIGCSVGVLGIIAGMMVEEGTWLLHGRVWFLVSPLLLFSTWLLLNIPFLIFQVVRFIRGDGDGYVTWGAVIAVESLFVMLGWVGDFTNEWLAKLTAWAVWLVALTMAGTGIWLVRQMLINKWAQEMAMLRSANAQRRAEKEAEERKRMKMEDAR